MSDRGRTLLLGSLMLAFAGGAAAFWFVAPRPDTALSTAVSLAEAGRFDEAEALIAESIRRSSGSNESRMLAAQIAMNRPAPAAPAGEMPDPRPSLTALEHLGQVKPDSAYLSALTALYRGKAEYRLGRLDAAEESWLAALRHDKQIPEAGMHLLDLYYLEGRDRELRQLAIRLHEDETDRIDRVRYLLEPIRPDVQPPAPASLVQWFRPIVARNPDEFQARLALGLALGRATSAREGQEMLRPLLDRAPESADVWEAWLTVLDDAGELEQLEGEARKLPAKLAGSDRFARFHARIAQEQGDWKAAEDGFRRALKDRPSDRVPQYRLIRALRFGGKAAEAARVEQEYEAYQKAKGDLSALFRDALEAGQRGRTVDHATFRTIADLRERMGYIDEALAWHRMILRENPDDPGSRSRVVELDRRGKPRPAPGG